MERYTKKRLLGKGGFAEVYCGIDNKTGKECAMKIIDTLKMHPSDYENEITLFHDISHLSHPNIVKYETSFLTPSRQQCIIIMEYCKGMLESNLGGDLMEIIKGYKKKGERMPEDVMLELIVGILLGVHYIHQNGIVHLDLKPQNILIDDKGNPKITDFGIAKTLENSRKHTGKIVGSYMYMSPEALMGKPCETCNDMWSIGCIIHEMCCFQVNLKFIYSRRL